MEKLFEKREELHAQIKAIEADIRILERAIGMCGGSLGPARVFKRGKLKQMVCGAMREGHEGNHAIALEVITRMGWEATDERVKDVSVRAREYAQGVAQLRGFNSLDAHVRVHAN